MNTNPNQKIIQIIKKKGTDEILYTQIVVEAFDIALKLLSPTEYKVWTYLAKNANGFTFALSAVACMDACAISRSSYNSAVRRLIELGYLTQRSENSNVWVFHDLPQKEEEISELSIERP